MGTVGRRGLFAECSDTDRDLFYKLAHLWILCPPENERPQLLGRRLSRFTQRTGSGSRDEERSEHDFQHIRLAPLLLYRELLEIAWEDCSDAHRPAQPLAGARHFARGVDTI